MFVAKRKEFLRLVSAEFRKTGIREIATEDVINIGSVDTSWLTLPEPKSVRVVDNKWGHRGPIPRKIKEEIKKMDTYILNWCNLHFWSA